MPVFEADEVEFSYGPLNVLNGLTLAVDESEIFGILGANGAGKTTLMRLLIGLQKPSSGSVRVFGESPSSRIAGRIGYMPQLSALYQELSARQNVDFFARDVRPFPVWRAAGSGRPGNRMGRPYRAPEGPTHGASAAACASASASPLPSYTSPISWCWTSPPSASTPELRASFWEHFRSMASSGTTLIISSHTMDDASHCHRLAFIQEGRVVALGTPDELRAAAGEDDATLEDAFLHFVRQGGLS